MPPSRTAWLQSDRPHGSLFHVDLLARELTRRGYTLKGFTSADLFAGRVPLSPDAMLSGSIQCLGGAFRRLGIAAPMPSYPEVLRDRMHRRSWRDSFARMRRSVLARRRAVFAKPADGVWLFDGRVFAGPADFRALPRVPLSTPVLCSEVVRWRSEYRAYVAEGRLLGVFAYSDPPHPPLDPAWLGQAMARLAADPALPRCYTLDFGRMAGPRTALVECDDVFGVANYGLSDADYTDMVLAGWREAMARAGPVPAITFLS